VIPAYFRCPVKPLLQPVQHQRSQHLQGTTERTVSELDAAGVNHRKYLWKIHVQKPKNNTKELKKIGKYRTVLYIYLCSKDVYSAA
jgi:hypothetical protein